MRIRRKYAYVLLVPLVIFAAVLVADRSSSGQSEETEFNDADFTFYPSTYGLPDVIAGHEVLLIRTSNNTACLPEGDIHVTVSNSQPNRPPDSKLPPFISPNSGEVEKFLHEFDPDVQWSIGIVTPGGSQSEMIANVQRWNEGRLKSGCIQLGGPILTVTPTPNNVANTLPQ